MTEPFDPLPAAPPRPRLEVGRLWAGGVATAVVAALLALVGVLIVRVVLRIAVYAPAGAGAFGDSRTLVLCLGERRGRHRGDRSPAPAARGGAPAADLLQLDRRAAHRGRGRDPVHLLQPIWP